MWMFKDGKMFSKLTDDLQGAIFRVDNLYSTFKCHLLSLHTTELVDELRFGEQASNSHLPPNYDWTTDSFRIADSTHKPDDFYVFDHEDPDRESAYAKEVDEDENLEEDAQVPNIEEYTEEAEAADAQMDSSSVSKNLICFHLCRENAGMRKGLSVGDSIDF